MMGSRDGVRAGVCVWLAALVLSAGVPAATAGSAWVRPLLEEASEEARSTHARLAEELDEIREDRSKFFNQLELSIASAAFGEMQRAVEAMITEGGQVDTSQVDRFHNHLDEFVRAMDQLTAEDLPKESDYGKDAVKAAPKKKGRMELDAIVSRGKKLRKRLRELKKLANEVPALAEVDLQQPCADMAEFADYVVRVCSSVDVMTDANMGLGPRFQGAASEAKPLRKTLQQILQAAGPLRAPGLTSTSTEVETFGRLLKTAVKQAGDLGFAAKAWKNADKGNLGPACEKRLKAARKTFLAVRETLPAE